MDIFFKIVAILLGINILWGFILGLFGKHTNTKIEGFIFVVFGLLLFILLVLTKILEKL